MPVLEARAAHLRPPTLIVLRGNSASGKSTVAQLLQAERTKLHRDMGTRPMAYVSQDWLRRDCLRDKGGVPTNSMDLIELVTTFALQRGYDVVLDGIMKAATHREMLGRLTEVWPTRHFYFDVPLEETFRRHATKPIAAWVTEDDLRDWYRPLDLLGLPGEVVLDASLSAEEIARRIGLLLAYGFALCPLRPRAALLRPWEGVGRGFGRVPGREGVGCAASTNEGGPARKR